MNGQVPSSAGGGQKGEQSISRNRDGRGRTADGQRTLAPVRMVAKQRLKLIGARALKLVEHEPVARVLPWLGRRRRRRGRLPRVEDRVERGRGGCCAAARRGWCRRRVVLHGRARLGAARLPPLVARLANDLDQPPPALLQPVLVTFLAFDLVVDAVLHAAQEGELGADDLVAHPGDALGLAALLLGGVEGEQGSAILLLGLERLGDQVGLGERRLLLLDRPRRRGSLRARLGGESRVSWQRREQNQTHFALLCLLEAALHELLVLHRLTPRALALRNEERRVDNDFLALLGRSTILVESRCRRRRDRAALLGSSSLARGLGLASEGVNGRLEALALAAFGLRRFDIVSLCSITRPQSGRTHLLGLLGLAAELTLARLLVVLVVARILVSRAKVRVELVLLLCLRAVTVSPPTLSESKKRENSPLCSNSMSPSSSLNISSTSAPASSSIRAAMRLPALLRRVLVARLASTGSSSDEVSSADSSSFGSSGAGVDAARELRRGISGSTSSQRGFWGLGVVGESEGGRASLSRPPTRHSPRS